MLTAFGPITVTRRHFRCPGCQDAGYTADALIGIEGYLSPRVLRLACRLTSDRSFALAAERLFECCGIAVSDETLRRHCLGVGAEVADGIRNAPEAAVPFLKATGEVECQVDAGKVNTQGGWRDLKVGAFTKRPLGLAATPAEWTTRRLPPPSARIVLADLKGLIDFAATGVVGPTGWRSAAGSN